MTINRSRSFLLLIISCILIYIVDSLFFKEYNAMSKILYSILLIFFMSYQQYELVIDLKPYKNMDSKLYITGLILGTIVLWSICLFVIFGFLL